ncbi:MAG: MFS transporter, partial [Pseudonocardia sp.]|nr:MFS transporter [Pseudonocardia sp.]
MLPGRVLAAAGLAAVGSLAWYGSVVALLPGLLVFTLARPMVFTPAGVGAFLSHAGTLRALATSLATESRQLGAVLGVAVSTTAL